MGTPANSVFNDNQVAFGSRFEFIGSPPGSNLYSVENIRLNYPTKTIERSDPIGQPYGFVLVKGQPTGTCTIQVTAEGNATPVGGGVTTMPNLGDYMIDNFKAANEKWVIASLGAPYEQGGYRKVDVTIIQALFSGST